LFNYSEILKQRKKRLNYIRGRVIITGLTLEEKLSYSNQVKILKEEIEGMHYRRKIKQDQINNIDQSIDIFTDLVELIEKALKENKPVDL